MVKFHLIIGFHLPEHLHDNIRDQSDFKVWFVTPTLQACDHTLQWRQRNHQSASFTGSLGFLFFWTQNTKCFSTLKWSMSYVIACEMNYWENNYFGFTCWLYWCFPRSLCLMPQSANCAGKLSDFTSTDVLRERAYTIARTLGRPCETNVSFL